MPDFIVRLDDGDTRFIKRLAARRGEAMAVTLQRVLDEGIDVARQWEHAETEGEDLHIEDVPMAPITGSGLQMNGERTG